MSLQQGRRTPTPSPPPKTVWEGSGSRGKKRASKEEKPWEAEARRIDKKLRPFLDKVCKPRLARVVAMVLLVADNVCDVPVLREHNHKQLAAALDTDNEFKIKAEVGGALCGVLRTCMGGARRPLTAGEKRLADHLKNAATLMDAYDPLKRGKNTHMYMYTFIPKHEAARQEE